MGHLNGSLAQASRYGDALSIDNEGLAVGGGTLALRERQRQAVGRFGANAERLEKASGRGIPDTDRFEGFEVIGVPLDRSLEPIADMKPDKNRPDRRGGAAKPRRCPRTIRS